ncbi:MAG: efflux RND transporter permease subunit [Phycisphaerales bacterium]|nr:efflux RND transporter permease subunit [Planctomycetota bacterium]MCH8509520.1 efflux RND transporter permease subunit [Phycisphaerales bacterium]
MSIARFGVRKPVVANLVMLTIIGAGVLFGLTLRREFFPYVQPRIVSILAPYPGAAPAEVESALARKIEDSVADITGVKEIVTTVSEGLAAVLVEFEDGVSIERAAAEVKREMDALQDLPEQSDRIIVDIIEPNLPAIVLSIAGDADERTMKNFIRQCRDDLLSLPGITDISPEGFRADELRVEVEPELAVMHRMSLSEISDRVAAAMVEMPGGSVRGQTSTVAVRSMGVEERADAVRNIVLRAQGQGGVLRLGDIATVSDGFVDDDLEVRFNGKPAMTLTVFRVGQQDVIRIADMVKAYAAGRRGEDIELNRRERVKLALLSMGTERAADQRHRAALEAWERNGADPGARPERMARPPDPAMVSDRYAAYRMGLERYQVAPPPGDLDISTDLARFVKGRLDLLTRNAFQGGLLVFATLVVLLNWRISFWVALGLIVSMLGALAVMSIVGVTLNLLTMFGLIIVIGILVDDAIVVSENIAARHERGELATVAAVRGTDQVLWPVVTTVLTTICAFLPLALIDGQIGDFLGVLPVVVACALGISLIECLYILPVHMADSLRGVDRARVRKRESRLRRVEARMDRGREWFFQTLLMPRYTRLLEWSITHRYITIAAALAVLVVSAGMYTSGRLEFIFFEEDDAETINITVTMPIGTALSRTDEVVGRVESIALAQPEVASIFAQAGAVGELDGATFGSNASHLGQIILELTPVEFRDRPSSQVIQAIQDELGVIPDVRSIRMEGVSGGPGGPALTFTAVGDEGADLHEAVRRIKRVLADYDGVYGIADDSDAGSREIRFTLRDGASELGFTRASLGRQIQAMVFGLEPYTFAGDREDVKVRVITPDRVRRSLAALERQFVFTPDGTPVPLSEVADIEEGETEATIRRIDRRRAISVTADVNRALGNPDRIAAEIAPILAERVADLPGVRLIERGRQKDMKESFGSLPLGMALAAGLIYVILAWLFGSFTQPLAVMAAIPFATIGMIWGHLILGYALTFLSLIGFIALAGVVVNDSLILMEFFNHERRNGVSVREAGIAAGRARLRAIVLTTVTTVLGLTPLMLEQSFQARFLIPMAITIACGLLSATVIILVVLPSLLMVLDDIAHAGRVLWTGRTDVPRRNPMLPNPELRMLDEPVDADVDRPHA